MADIIDEQLARELGVSEPLVLDASILDLKEEHEIVREDVKLNRVQYVFPAGLNQIDLLEECRALGKLEDFDMMYDITMQMLENKPVVIYLYHNDGSKQEIANFHVTDRYMDLRGIEVISAYPILVNWLTEFIGGTLLKKYPTPSVTAPQVKVSKTTSGKGKRAATS